jgi:hypothetical protein
LNDFLIPAKTGLSFLDGVLFMLNVHHSIDMLKQAAAPSTFNRQLSTSPSGKQANA